ncbi:MAG TPA: PDZ domain-containing protein [Gammaproteobacteria bacterium]|nr:PDZ domain-containing protein [Gammaproteobacteria bacterium]
MKTASLFALVLLCGAVAGHVLLRRDGPAETPATTAGPEARHRFAAAAGGTAPPERVLESLAGIVEAEVAERRRLERKLDKLTAEVAALRGESPKPAPRAPEPDRAVAALGDDLRVGALTQAGIEEVEAREIKRRMDELDMEMMNLQYEAGAGGWMGTERFADAFRDLRARRESVRESIGDETWDKYLYAMGQPNRVAVQEVLEGSPAQRAGLRPGDLLLSYAGDRLFTLNDLVERSRRGGGETVTVEILRDGRRTQIYMPRGPLGIRSSFFRADPADPAS